MIQGAVLSSSEDAMYANDDCTLSFTPAENDAYQTRRLMMRFTHYNVTDCSVALEIYYRSLHDYKPAVSCISI